MRKKLTLLGTLVALAVVSLVSVAAVNAGGSGGSSEQRDRVAEILGISPEELSDAVGQARSEAHATRLEERLSAAVEEGVLTDAEADAIREWSAGRPEALSELSKSDRHGLKRAQRGDGLTEFLASLVSDEVLTQADSDEIASWFDAKPTDALQKIRPEAGGQRGLHGRHGERFRPEGAGGFRGGRGFGHPSHGGTEPGAETGTPVRFF